MKFVLKGVSACPGVVQGNCFIYSDEKRGAMKKGDILVVRNTNPSMLMDMAKAAAIIAEVGGICSHVAIVSREMGIPCLVGVKDATKKLVDKKKLKVDATKGNIYELD